MSLTKLFNFKYLLQNLKKSKMAITLFFIIVPIFTSLMLITLNEDIYEYAELGIINILAMYVIPFVLSVSLFGYVFKKNSTDFIGSMPISRKTIFATNTLGGIIIIFLLQLTTFLLTLLLGALLKINIFAGMAFDLFVYQTIAYIFVFIVSNLAMSVSGNVFTQIVVTLLITFIIPFSVFFVELYNSNSYMIMDGTNEIAYGLSRIFNYTAPSLIFSGSYSYNVQSLVKMIVLSIIYVLVGIVMFSKRKMEIAGESFENKYTHLVVKGLTLTPFVALLIAIDDDFGAALFVLGIIAIYFFIYDLITGKKIKILDNIIAFVLSLAAIYGVYSAAIAINDGDKEINIKSISSVQIEIGNVKSTINDKELIESLLCGTIRTPYSYNAKSSIVGIDMVIYTNFGEKYTYYSTIGENKLDEILENIYFNELKLNDVKFQNSYLNLSDEEQKQIVDRLNTVLPTLKYSELEPIRNNSFYTFSLYEYKNHETFRYNFPINIDEEIYRLLIKKYNEYAYNYAKLGKEIYWFDVEGKNNEVLSNWSYEAYEEMSKFIIEHYDDEIENLDNVIFIYGSQFKFFTDKVDEFNEKVGKYHLGDDYYRGDKAIYEYEVELPVEEIVVE